MIPTRSVLFATLIWTMSCSGAASACSVTPQSPITKAELEIQAEQRRAQFVDRTASAEAVVYVQAVSTSGFGRSSARIRVLEVLKGRASKGRVLWLKTTDSGLCGAGGLVKGQKGVIVLGSERPRAFKGFIHPLDLETLRKSGL
jgi:hypothetical protein